LVATITRTFTIGVTAVNDPPSFVAGPDQLADDGSGAKSVPGWATAISAGPPEEASQTLIFNVLSNSNPALFSGPLTVSTNGTELHAGTERQRRRSDHGHSQRRRRRHEYYRPADFQHHRK
jgi:hypothetical protein